MEITERSGGHLTTAEQPDRLAEVIAAPPEHPKRGNGGSRLGPPVSRAVNLTVVRFRLLAPSLAIGSPVAVVVMGMVVAGVPAMLASVPFESWSQYDRETPSTSMVRPNRSWSLLAARGWA